MLPYPVIVFDLDGTLMLTLDGKVENAVCLWHEKFGAMPEKIRAAYLRHSGMPRERLFREIAIEVLNRRLEPEEYQKLSAQFTALNIEVLRNQPFVDGAVELLRDLNQTGVLLFISSSAEKFELETRLKDSPLLLFFDKILHSDDLFFHKGKPHLRYIQRTTGFPIAVMLVVGDEPNDLHLTREVGAKIALVAQTRPFSELEILNPDILVNTFTELRPYLLS